MTDRDREHFVSNLAGHMSAGVSTEVQERAVTEMWSEVDRGLGETLRRRLGLEPPESAGSSS